VGHNLDFLIEIISFGLIIGGVALGIQLNYLFFILPILVIIFLLIYQKKKREKYIKMQMKIIKDQWGKEREESLGLSNKEDLHNFLSKKEEVCFKIDNITWFDLDMDTVFSKMDHTMSLPGIQYLYYILRRPFFEENVLKKRNKKINLLRENKSISHEIQYPISILGKEKGTKIFTYFENGLNVDTKPLMIYELLSYLPYLPLVLFFFNTQIAFSLFILVIMVNAGIYNSNKRRIYEEMETFKYLGSLINCAENIVKLNSDGLNEELILHEHELKELLKETRRIKKNISKINYNEDLKTETQVLMDYYNMIFLREPKVFYKTVKQLNKHKEDIFRIYTIIGKIDAYISVASYTSGLDYYAEPNLKNESSKLYLKTKEMYHPLLDNPVPYSFELSNKGALITGSNASGKSTFLRTIGINAILAQTLYMVLAKDYNSSYFKLFTSIGTTDSIVKGDSYFMAEAKALKRVIDSLRPNYPILCILDEIFRGTNTTERISAASVVLNYMIDKNACVVAATHDLELTTLVNSRYENYHFKETIENKDIIFDYILRKGTCVSRNAIAILKYLGYPGEIYEKAVMQAEKYS